MRIGHFHAYLTGLAEFRQLLSICPAKICAPVHYCPQILICHISKRLFVHNNLTHCLSISGPWQRIESSKGDSGANCKSQSVLFYWDFIFKLFFSLLFELLFCLFRRFGKLPLFNNHGRSDPVFISGRINRKFDDDNNGTVLQDSSSDRTPEALPPIDDPCCHHFHLDLWLPVQHAYVVDHYRRRWTLYAILVVAERKSSGEKESNHVLEFPLFPELYNI